MTRLAFVIHSNPEVAGRIARTLEADGFRTGRAGSPEAARQLLEALVPEVALVEVAMLHRDGGAFRRWWRDAASLAAVPVVALANGRPETRRDALRLGLTNVLHEPLDDEELVLATRAAVGDSPAADPDPGEVGDGDGGAPSPEGSPGGELRGSLAHLPVADLLSMIEIHRRSGRVRVQSGDARADFEYEDGHLASARTTAGEAGEDALGTVLGWRRGTFVAHLDGGGEAPGPASATPPEPDPAGAAEAEPPTGRRAEVEALFTEESGAGDDVQPWQAVLHRTLSTLNLAVSYAAATATPERVAEEAEAHRRRLEGNHPALALFFVDEAGVVSLRPGLDPRLQVPETVEAEARIWLQDLFDGLARVQPEDFSRYVLDGFIESVAGDAGEEP